MTKKKKEQFIKLLNELWDLFHNPKALTDATHQKEIRELKARIEILLMVLNTKDDQPTHKDKRDRVSALSPVLKEK